MKFSLIMIAVVVSGCSGLIDPGPGGGGNGSDSVATIAAKAKWESEAYPIFKSVCFACHGGAGPGPSFVQATTVAEMRTTLMGWDPQVVNTDAPESSRVLSKGAHNGTPALVPTQLSAIIDWLTAEKDALAAGDETPTLSTTRIEPLLCTGGTPGVTTGCTSTVPDPTQCCPINHVTLDDVGLPGASIDFVAQALGSDLYLSDIYLRASADGVYLDHPLFVSWPTATGGTPIPDTLDRFFAVKLNLAASSTTAPACPGPSCDHIGAGAAAFVGFIPKNYLSITFKTLEKYHVDTTMPTAEVGCGTQGFASFIANVQPITTVCRTCHAGTANAGARNAMDLTGIASTTDNTTCHQMLLHLTLQNPGSSGLLLAPQAGVDLTHPAGGKLSGTTNPTFAAWSTAVNKWITAEINEP